MPDQELKENSDAQTPSPAPAPVVLKKRQQFKPPAFVHPPKKPAPAPAPAPAATLLAPPADAPAPEDDPPAPTFKAPKVPKLPALKVRPSVPKKPLAAAAPTSRTSEQQQAPSGHPQGRYFAVLYTKYQPTKKLRKNKAFSDGILEIKPGNKATLFEPEGKVVVTTTLRGYDIGGLGAGSNVIMGNWELEIDDVVPAERFLSGDAFVKPSAAGGGGAAGGVPGSAGDGGGAGGSAGCGFRPPALARPSNAAPFRRPLAPGAAPPPRAPPPQLHDPRAPGAIILNESQWRDGTGRDAAGNPVAAVVLDPLLARHMRPHQIEGVRFLYECTAGIRTPGQYGAILADAMGLGKTLTTLALLWTLLRQGPAGRPTVAKALVVTPSSLTRNWAAEAKKWLGDERMRCAVIPPGAGGAPAALAFKHGNAARVAIASYETVRQHAAALAGAAGVLICDEGHRLKSASGSKTISALLSLGCTRRVILSGTPFQNNLAEFFAMADFVCPDVLGALPAFNRVFATPIARSRDKGASEEDRELGEARAAELGRRVESFVLRRGAEVNASYLPPLSLYVVFCPPSPQQLAAITEVLGSGSVRRLLGGGGAAASGSDFGDQALSVLTTLRKICNHPALAAVSTESGANSIDTSPKLSGKMAALALLLDTIISSGGSDGSSATCPTARCVVVSQSTAMLDLIAALCAARGWSNARIDGSTDVSKRQDAVDAFNRHGVGQVFLLSTTAGGAGLNLTGACRLVLIDSHWNPALDQQAMARVWRDGQRHPCVVYRLVTTGTVEEKVYQRQRAKGDIAAMTVCGEGGEGGGRGAGGGLVDASKGAGAAKEGQFTREELRQLFAIRTDTRCDTADVLGAETFPDASEDCEDAPLAAAVAAGLVSYVNLEAKRSEPAAAVAEVAEGAVEVKKEKEEEEERKVIEYGDGEDAAQVDEGQKCPDSGGGSGGDSVEELKVDDDWDI